MTGTHEHIFSRGKSISLLHFSSVFFFFFWIWSLSNDSTKTNYSDFVENFDAVSPCEDETEKSVFWLNHPSLVAGGWVLFESLS